ncbi:uncharacterized protein BYT42DRAFT_488489 [Radiomyces spectabilis]|uniref:uncharacterized protein n=1 Tax=Radiomyces spectabilis TaxID=64574 RepID=UPI00221EE828|nr:uncharacterized protein BYT42DRAFT_488489 [Radiomyces spectabilis]KAI8394202.1 hypothetical protein BYT42DRAFT_488489 [Radiomyces spectabilis]
MNSLHQVDELVKEYLLIDKIIEELLGCIVNGDVQNLIDYYRYLDLRFFSRLDSRFQPLPYVKQPATDPQFEMYFSKQWVDNYTISLHNFLATTFQNMPLPSLLLFNIDRLQRKAQQAEIETLKTTIDSLKASIQARENEIAKLKHELIETRKEVTDGISLIRQRAASMTLEPKNGAKTKAVVEKSEDPNASSENVTLEKAQQLSVDEPFVVVSQEEFSEHASAITHAKFSTRGNLIASCDMDNIVRIWSYKGQSFNPMKISNNTSNILSMEWDARSDRFVSHGSLTYSPVEPILICAGSSSRMSTDNGKRYGALVAWNLKSMCATLNHNGQMLVAGDQSGLIRIFGKMKPDENTSSRTPSNTEVLYKIYAP